MYALDIRVWNVVRVLVVWDRGWGYVFRREAWWEFKLSQGGMNVVGKFCGEPEVWVFNFCVLKTVVIVWVCEYAGVGIVGDK